jgi:hypothetical protein
MNLELMFSVVFMRCFPGAASQLSGGARELSIAAQRKEKLDAQAQHPAR